MERTKYQCHYGSTTLEDIDGVESYMSKEELEEMRIKCRHLVASVNWQSGDAQTLALMEKFFKIGYLAAHIIPGAR